jgi:glycosyltransferase involved in cell wall biosynthesis
VKKILIMNEFIIAGGIETVMMDFVKNLDRESYSITILTPELDPLFYKYYGNHIEYICLYNSLYPQSGLLSSLGNKVKRYVGRLSARREIERRDFDIAISLKEGFCMKFISSIKASKKLAWVQGDYGALHWTKVYFKEGEELECMRKFDSVVCVSKQVKESLLELVGDPENLVVRDNPIDESRIREMSKEAVDYRGERTAPTFISIGRLTEVKGFDLMLRVCRRLNEEGYVYSLDIVGDGEEKSSLFEYAAENKLENVRLLGFQKNPYKYLRQADWFISTSKVEGYAIVIQEAAILGVPVMATDCSGVKELLGEKNEYGIVMEIDEESIYESMKRVISDRNIHRHYKEQIKERAKAISVKERIKKIEELF